MSNVIKQKIRVSGGNLPNGFSIEIPVTVDFSDATNDDMMNWAMSNRKIALQRVLRELTPDELREMETTGITRTSHQCGQKIASREDQIKKMTDAGIPRHHAEKLVDNPELLDKLNE